MMHSTFEEQFAAKAGRVRPSAPSTTNWHGVRDLVAEQVGLDPGDVYVSTISKPGNVTVRFGQSGAANSGELLLAMHTDLPSALEKTIAAMGRVAAPRGAAAAVATREDGRWSIVAILGGKGDDGVARLASGCPGAVLLSL